MNARADAGAAGDAAEPADETCDSADDAIDAGDFGTWLQQARRVLRGQGESDVPCGDCTGCCRASWYIRIRPQDRPAIVGLAQAWLVRPDNIEPGHALLAWRSDGRCPLLEHDRCTIYAQRPVTCRDFDCRVFAAAGLTAGDERRAMINERVRRWRFRHADDDARRAHEAIRRAAGFLRSRRECFPDQARDVPVNVTGIAVFALKAMDVFLDPALAGADDARIARAMLEAVRAFDQLP